MFPFYEKGEKETEREEERERQRMMEKRVTICQARDSTFFKSNSE